MVRIGEGIGDIAYFLATALAPETHRQHEENLLPTYQQSLYNHDVTINTEWLIQLFRARLCYPFEAMTLTLAIGGMMVLTNNLELIRRSVSAVEDHNTLSALPI